MKSRQGSRVFRERLGQKFDGYDLAELQIFGTIDLTHAATACQRDDAITIRNDLAGDETSAAEGIGT
jgi:hypothetical protein